MSTPTTPTPPAPPTSTAPPAPGAAPTKMSQIKLISHSSLFYWWPVWVLSFFMAAWTYMEGNRLAIVPAHGKVTPDAEGGFDLSFKTSKGENRSTPSLERAATVTKNTPQGATAEPFGPRVSQHTWPGTVFAIVLLLTVVVTNVPMRGLWSFIILVLIGFVAIMFAFLGWWDRIFESIENLQIHINLAGYLFIGTGVFIMWAMATFLFDKRSYVIFTPGQIRVCEHIGAAVQTYNSAQVNLEKQRDDIFRHYIFGFGSGDLILKVGDRKEIRLANVLGVGSRLRTAEDMLRSVATTTS